jgi:hypothetical protein
VIPEEIGLPEVNSQRILTEPEKVRAKQGQNDNREGQIVTVRIEGVVILARYRRQAILRFHVAPKHIIAVDMAGVERYAP